jgi:hypothetical protein
MQHFSGRFFAWPTVSSACKPDAEPSRAGVRGDGGDGCLISNVRDQKVCLKIDQVKSVVQTVSCFKFRAHNPATESAIPWLGTHTPLMPCLFSRSPIPQLLTDETYTLYTTIRSVKRIQKSLRASALASRRLLYGEPKACTRLASSRCGKPRDQCAHRQFFSTAGSFGRLA